MADHPHRLSEEFLKVLSFTERLTYSEKMKNKGAWVKRKAAAYDRTYPTCFSEEYVQDVTDGLALLSGDPMIFYKKQASGRAKLDAAALLAEGVDAPDTKMKHFDSVTFFIEGLLGDEQRRELRYRVTDSSATTQNDVKREESRVTTEYFRNKFVIPLQQQYALDYMVSKGYKDLYQLNPEQRQEMQVDVDRMVEQNTPRSIKRYLKTGYRSPLEIKGQELADIFVNDTNLKFIVDQAYYYSFATSAFLFKQGIRNDRPYLEHVADPRQFNTWGTASKFINNNSGFKYTKKMHPSDVLDTYGQKFTKEDFDKFSDYISRGSHGSRDITRQDETWIRNIPFEALPELGNINMLSKEGQSHHQYMEAKYSGEDYRNMDMVRVVELVWKSLRLFKLVKRLYPDNTIRFDWHSEEYTFNKNNGDISITKHWFNEYFKCVIIGEGDNCVYVDYGPEDYQFRDITDPRIVHGPFVGFYLNDMDGMGSRTSPMKKIRPFVDIINFEYKIIQDREATDIGKVMLMTIAAKPEKWSWGKYVKMIRTLKIVPIDTLGAGLTPSDVAFFKELDLGNTYELVPRLNMIQGALNSIAQILAANDARRGMQAASTSVTNNMMNMDRSISQTNNMSVWKDMVTEMLIQNGIYLYQMAAKGGNLFLRRALSDLSTFTIDSQVDDTEDPKYFVKVLMDTTKINEIDIAKNIIHPMLQQPNADIRDALRIMAYKSMSQIEEVLDDVQMDKEIQAMKAQEANMLSLKEQQEFQKELVVLTEELKKNRELLLSADKKEMAAMNSMVQANASDINRDGINDYAATADKDRAFKREELAQKLEIEREKIRASLLKDSKRTPVATK